MIINSSLQGANSFVVLKEDTLSKQQRADLEVFPRLETSIVSLVAQEEMQDAAGYIVEDSNGDLHRIGYMLYTKLNIDKLFLPPIVLPKPTMTLEEALIAMVKFAPICIEKSASDNAFTLPRDFVIAREVLGGREPGMKVFEAIVQVFKSRK